MYKLENWSHSKYNRVWRIRGEVFKHPVYADGSSVWISCPVDFDEQNMVVQTISGSLYKLGQCAGDLNKEIVLIREDVACGQYKRE